MSNAYLHEASEDTAEDNKVDEFVKEAFESLTSIELLLLGPVVYLVVASETNLSFSLLLPRMYEDMVTSELDF